MAVCNLYSIHPRLAKYAAGWDTYAMIAGNEDADLWLAYCEYLGEHDSWDGEPLRFDDWLTEQQRYAAMHDATTGQLCDAVALLVASFGTDDADDVLRITYALYASVTDAPLPYWTWRAALARAAERPAACACVAPPSICCSVRPHLRVLR